jgi:N-acetylglucosamine-6-sulfatase
LLGTTEPKAKPRAKRSAFLVEAIEDSVRGRPAYDALRTHTHLYVEYATGERELYDMRADPHQLENVYDQVDPALARDLQEQLGALKRCVGEACQVAEGGVVSEPMPPP